MADLLISNRKLNHRLRGRLNTIKSQLQRRGVAARYGNYVVDGSVTNEDKTGTFRIASSWVSSSDPAARLRVTINLPAAGEYLAFQGDKFNEGIERIVKEFGPRATAPAQQWPEPVTA
jgi:hypothetical protein